VLYRRAAAARPPHAERHLADIDAGQLETIEHEPPSAPAIQHELRSRQQGASARWVGSACLDRPAVGSGGACWQRGSALLTSTATRGNVMYIGIGTVILIILVILLILFLRRRL
jgi:hypothetical protein